MNSYLLFKATYQLIMHDLCILKENIDAYGH